MLNNSLGDRMKKYENHYRFLLLNRIPTIIRVDGKSFHTFTRGMKKPFDESFCINMDIVANTLLNEIQNARFAFVQSDEISILLIDYNKFNSQQWFDGNIQKMASISASIASSSMSRLYNKLVVFDSRVFVLPENEVVNYFVWRQQDATRNSIQSVAQSFYSSKQLHNKNCDELQEMIFNKGVNWNNYPSYYKRGRVITKSVKYCDIPLFTKNRQFVENFMKIEEK